MKIHSIRIENFRSYADETILFDEYTCIVGPNGAGKSTVLAALNVFFRQYKDSRTDLSRLSADDFHHRNTSKPISITVTFTDLNEQAKEDLSDYVRQEQLVVSSIAKFDEQTGRAEVRQYGKRLGIEGFRRYFEAEKSGASAKELASIFAELKVEWPELENARTKDQMASTLQSYESSHPEKCVLIPSEDQFYGATKGANRLSPHIQWIFVSATKDPLDEATESKSSALGQLLSRTIRATVDFDSQIRELKQRITAEYGQILASKQSALDGMSASIERSLKLWAHPNATARLCWKNEEDKAVRVEEPWAAVLLGEREFEGDLARFGHGMQRSYLLTLLQLISDTDTSNAPTLVMAIEEPELYQHPPQIRYLSELLQTLADSGSQIIVCTHSPHFVPGDRFDRVRLVRETGSPAFSRAASVGYDELTAKLSATNKSEAKESGVLAKLYPCLNPQINEMFFCRCLILVEGIEDVAYLMTNLALGGRLDDFRAAGAHIVPAGGKSEIVRPLAIALLLDVPVFVMIDADTNETNAGRVALHKGDNRSILALLGHHTEPDWPPADIFKNNLVVWTTCLTDRVAQEGGPEWASALDRARVHYGGAGNLTKNPLAIARALNDFRSTGFRIASLDKACDAILLALN